MPKFPRSKCTAHYEESGLAKIAREMAMKDAVLKVIDDKMSLRAAAELFDVSKSALQRKLKTFQNLSDDEKASFTFGRRFGFNSIFNEVDEGLLSKYFLQAADICYGLTEMEACEVAYEFAAANNKEVPASWHRNKAAGLEWLRGFLYRHPIISIRKPEPTSLSRMTSFNKHNVGIFYANLEKVLVKEKFTASQIYNVDETGTTTVQKSARILARRGQKQVGKAVSGERGTLVTTCATICADGTFIPPVMVFPRKRYQQRMVTEAPPGTLGLVSPKGWMQRENFDEYMKHFIKCTGASKEKKVLLILDNHGSHLSIPAIRLAKENGVIILTLPPHCSHRMQPLDVGCYGPFKTYYNKAADIWMINNPGATLTIYDIPFLVKAAYPKSFSPSNILNSFKKTGIWPYNPDSFTDRDFLCSYVTDRAHEDVVPGPLSANDDNVIAAIPGPLSTRQIVSPEDVRPFAKAGPRKLPKKNGRKKTTSELITDTPVKNRLELENEQKAQKAKEKVTKAKATLTKRANRMLFQQKRKIKLEKGNTPKRKVSETESEDDENLDSILTISGSEDEDANRAMTATVGDFVIVRYSTKRSVQHFVGCIVSISGIMEMEAACTVSFLKRGHSWKFSYPEQEDIDAVPLEDIIKRLPKPAEIKGTARAALQIDFNFDFSTYKLA